MYAEITVMSPTSILHPHYFQQSSLHLNKTRVSSNEMVGYFSFWVSFVII